MYLSKYFLLVPFVLFYTCAEGQKTALYNYQDLSHIFYGKQKDSLKKNWVCPALFSEKATQKKYKEIWDERTGFITASIESDVYIHEQEVFDYIEDLVDQIAYSNKQLVALHPLVLLDRSASPNAYAIGNNIIAVNLGLISFVQSREELALAIAHELAHNILSHPENAMKGRAEWLTSDAYYNSISSVMSSRYERLTRLQKVLENFSFDRRRHQRYNENEADSLAIVLLKNSNIGFNAAFFLRLDSADNILKQPLRQPVKSYFASYNLAFEDWWIQKRSKGLSSRNNNFTDSNLLSDSLKTHPDCISRYNKTADRSEQNMKETPIPATIKEKAIKMLLWNLFSDMNLTSCLYRVLLEKDKGQSDPWYDFMISNVLGALYYADKELHRFNAIGILQKEYVSQSYYELQTMLEQIPGDSLEQYCRQLQRAEFWNSMTTAENSLKNLLSELTLKTDNSDKNKSRIAKEFIANNNTSMYCEFANAFIKK